MKLTHKQKKYVKRNFRRITVDEISQELHISPEDIRTYLAARDKSSISESHQNSRNEKTNQSDITVSILIKKYWKYLLGLAILVCITYANSLFNGFVSDDRVYLDGTTFSHISSAFSSPLFFLRPLLTVLIYKAVGPVPVFYRLVNIFFHIGSVWLVFLIINKLHNKYTAILTSILFAVHPVLIESVGWISGGLYPMYSFFLLLSFFVYILDKTNTRYYILSVLFFALGLSSSLKALVYPGIVFAYEVFLGDIKKNWKRLISFSLLSVIWVIWSLGQVGTRLETTAGYGTQDINTFYNPLILIPVAVSSYIILLLWPQDLSIYHIYPSISQLQYAFYIGIFLMFLLIYFISLKKNKLIFFFMSFFLISIAFNLTPLKIAWVVAERYIYLGSIGIFFVISYIVYKASQYKKFQTLAYFLITVAIFTLMVRSIVRNAEWKNEDTLWVATAKTAPTYPVTHNNLGDMYGRHGDINRSIAEFKKAIELNPSYADAYHNLGNAYRDKKDYKNALKSYEKASSINPTLWQSYQNIAAIYFEKKDYKIAEDYMKKALSVAPQSPQLNTNIGIIYLARGEKAQAQKYFQIALTLDPTDQIAKQGYLQATSEK